MYYDKKAISTSHVSKDYPVFNAKRENSLQNKTLCIMSRGNECPCNFAEAQNRPEIE